VFHQNIGISPKLYCELARFQSALGHLGSAVDDNWAQIAFAAGYSDQSHMISEFRRFSGLTPGVLQNGRWFHPFIERSAPYPSRLFKKKST
jgi:transcriptional regulator GlxA family with amidase domain